MNLSTPAEYSFPGVLHYLQVEWRRFERERNEWTIERAQMKARIALLEGERRGVEQVKLDLMKRVKMLEYALRQERKKYLAANNKQQHLHENADVDSPNAPSSPVVRNTETSNQQEVSAPIVPLAKPENTAESSVAKAKERSRHALKACLDEINYLTSMPTKFPLMPSLTTETMLRTNTSGSPGSFFRQAASSSSSSSFEYSGHTSPELSNTATAAAVNDLSKGNNSNARSPPSKQAKNATHSGSKRSNPFLTPIPKNKESMRSKHNTMSTSPTTTSASTITTAGEVEPIPSVESSQTSREAARVAAAVEEQQESVPANVDEVAMLNNNNNNSSDKGDDDSNNDDVDMDTDDTSMDENALLSKEMQEKYNLSEEKVQRMLKSARKGTRRSDRSSSSPEPQDGEFSLKGNLDPSQLNDIDEVGKKQEHQQPKMWKPRVTIKGHLDSVRAVAFHPTEMMVASGSDDGTVKIWNLQRTIGKDGNPVRKAAHEEADPVIAYRGHNHIVTQVAISAEQKRVYSSSLDSTIRVWRLPSEGHNPSLSMATYVGHTDAIWDFKLFPIAREDTCLLASASADGTVKLWDTQTSGQLLKSSLTFDGVLTENDHRRNLPVPTSLDFCHTDLTKMAVSFANAQIRIYDIETGQVVTTLEGSNDTYDGTVGTQINTIIAHPTMPLIVTGHEDRQVKFYDLKSGTCAFSMSAHLDSVACLDIDPSGMTLVSGGHDSSIRLWDISMSKTCMQEFSAHRRKGHEGVLSVQYHKAYPWMVSGGADSIAKVYHHGHHH
ncbi:WD40-repeat-containing domain protein [Zychaea mexicana]|uniref:WD40-repeat-containing domain protein n=1 Tax=Zychaea mexicana TaxID=64656 RepID=UPI0022FF4574|nr:WD40-repeat-containing domain protein [Zychaea mexicana]KAI9496878.1 WD40-repeat-containing domain protein [Zychaea mexicana]